MTSLIPPSLTRGYIEEKVNMDRLNLSFLYLWYCKLFKQFGFRQQDLIVIRDNHQEGHWNLEWAWVVKFQHFLTRLVSLHNTKFVSELCLLGIHSVFCYRNPLHYIVVNSQLGDALCLDYIRAEGDFQKIKRYVGERTNMAEIRPEEQSKRKGVVWRIYGTKYSWKGHKDRNRHKNRRRRAGKLGLCLRHKL